MNKPVGFGRQPRFSQNGLRASLISAFFVLLTLALLFTPVAGPLRYGFPALTFVVSIFIYYQSKPFFAGFIVWLWMLAPLVRRLVEYRGGGTAPLIIASPFLACAVPLLLSLSSIGDLLSPEGYPVLFATVGIVYGVGVGILLHNHIALVASDVAFWVAPVLFAFFLVRFRFQILEIRASIEKAFIWGTLTIAAYGLYQYFILGPWDALWIETTGTGSFGLAEPQQVRVFSTMNSPQSLAGFLVAGIFIAMRSQSKIKWLAIPLASVSLLLSSSRTSWLGFVAGFVYLVYRLPARQRIQIAVIALLSVGLLLVALQGDSKDKLTARFQSLAAPGEDNSVGSRLNGYIFMLPEMVSDPFGAGMGFDNSKEITHVALAGEGVSPQDSGVISILFGLGLPGALMYLTGVGSAVVTSFRRMSGTDSDELLAFQAIIICAIVTAFAVDTARAPAGFLTWMALAICATSSQMAFGLSSMPATRGIPVGPSPNARPQRPVVVRPRMS